jgi:hypothetical protein
MVRADREGVDLGRGFATTSTMMSGALVRVAMHRIAALHGLYGRVHTHAFESIHR